MNEGDIFSRAPLWWSGRYPIPHQESGPGSFAHILLPDRSCSSGGSMLFLMVPLVIVGWHEEKQLFPYS